MHHSNARLSIYGMGDISAFIKKGEAPAFVIKDGMGDVSTFMIKGDTPTFMMGGGMGDVPTFVIKGDVPRTMRVFFTCIIGDAQYECASPFCQRSRCVSDINLIEMRQEVDCRLFTLHGASSAR
jgi:hypothetical protein